MEEDILLWIYVEFKDEEANFYGFENNNVLSVPVRNTIKVRGHCSKATIQTVANRCVECFSN